MWLRKAALSFEKKISKNAELRAKFENEPQRFITSEADLDADIKGLSVLSEHPELYVEFVKFGCAQSLVGLLAHANADIAIDVVEIIGELTEEDTLPGDESWDILVDALLEADLLDLLVSNLSRLNEDDESDRNGVYYILSIIENLASRIISTVGVRQESNLLNWLLQRVQKKELSITQNKQYAAEVLAILAQTNPQNRLKLINLDGVDILLELVALYRKRDPDRGSEEEEYMENLFEALTCLVDETEGRTRFIEAEGVELCLIMLKESRMSKASALRLLDHAAGVSGIETCSRLVEAGGLKVIFALFNKTNDQGLLDHCLTIFASMLRLLPSESAERIRTLAKFVEKDYAKMGKLLRLRRDYSRRIEQVERQARVDAREIDDRKEAMEVELLSRKLDAGLFNLQLIDVILAWLAAEDGGARQRIRTILAERGEGLGTIRATIEEQMKGLDVMQDGNREMKDMLGTLIEFLQ